MIALKVTTYLSAICALLSVSYLALKLAGLPV